MTAPVEQKLLTKQRRLLIVAAIGMLLIGVLEATEGNWRSAASSSAIAAMIFVLGSGWGAADAGRGRRLVYWALLCYVLGVALWRVLLIVRPSPV